MDIKFLICFSIIGLIIALSIADFFTRSKEDRIEILINWAKKEVYEAEEFFGSGTGQLKLAAVYNIAIKQFPWLGKLLTYDEFNEKVVKPALKWLNEQIDKNMNIKQLLEVTKE